MFTNNSKGRIECLDLYAVSTVTSSEEIKFNHITHCHMSRKEQSVCCSIIYQVKKYPKYL